MDPGHFFDVPGILLLGADRSRLLALRETLAGLHTRIVLASSTAAAEGLLRRYRFHVLAVDLESIAGAREEEIKALRGQAVTSETSVIFLTQDCGPPAPLRASCSLRARGTRRGRTCQPQ
jgi:hypothetical protein